MRGLGMALACACAAFGIGGSARASSPDALIAFATDRAPGLHRLDLVSVDVDGGGRQILRPRLGESLPYSLVRSRNGSRTAYRSAERTIVLRIGGRTIVRELPVDGYPAEFSPSGRRLAVQSFAPAIWLLPAEGRAHRLVGGGVTPSWSADGRRLAYGGDWIDWQDEAHTVFVVDADGRHRRRIATGSHPHWAPRGALLEFTSYEESVGQGCRGVCISNATGTRIRAVAPGTVFAGWLPDGRHLLSADQDGMYSTVRFDGRDRRRLPLSADCINVAWSHDARKLACTIGGRVLVFDRPTRTTRTVVDEGAGAEISALRWSRDERRLTFAEYLRSNDHEIATIQPDGRRVRMLTHNAVEDRHPAWSPDRRTIAFDRGDGYRSWIYLMDADGRRQRPLLDCPGDCGDSRPAWSPDGTKLAFLRGAPNGPRLAVASLDGGTATIVASLPAWETRPVWSRDGRWIVFAALPASSGPFGPQIYAVRPDGGELHVVVPGDAVAPSFSPDGRWLLYEAQVQSRGGTAFFLAQPDGSQPREVAPGSIDSQGATWSPDGTRVAYVDGSLDGETFVSVAHVESRWFGDELTSAAGSNVDPSWSP